MVEVAPFDAINSSGVRASDGSSACSAGRINVEASPTTLAKANTRTRSSANAAAADAARAPAPTSVSVKRKRFAELFDCQPEDVFGEKIQRLQEQDLLISDEHELRLNPK